jgi:lactoylglutathione lyase
MKIEHIAIWVKDLETMKNFYTQYFEMECNDKYVNSTKNFSSYYLSFGKNSTRIEIMHRPDIAEHLGARGTMFGLTHFAISVGSKEQVILLTEKIKNDGYIIASPPRTTGDGYYESVVVDPEGNHVEIVK